VCSANTEKHFENRSQELRCNQKWTLGSQGPETMPLDPALVLRPVRKNLTSLSFNVLTLEMRQLKPDDPSQEPKH